MKSKNPELEMFLGNFFTFAGGTKSKPMQTFKANDLGGWGRESDNCGRKPAGLTYDADGR